MYSKVSKKIEQIPLLQLNKVLSGEDEEQRKEKILVS